MAMITIRVTDEEKEWYQYMAEFYGISLSELIKTYSDEALEDEYDRQMLKVAKKLNDENPDETYSMKEILAEFGGLE
ncbi:type II toxin-antitoxin system RelB family antitoxin [Candidatus Enterococcus murrayae]|uniref:Antitoxin n=1 Tax=Candidatus Enterococcus murrayae TaxID=2815321 RepID=A0ABS3HMD6_9ENTE|nr:DUF6290 family protein [Enterococcus sp. MJM16]MBO0454606.1 antitoxin [Enterococcus sp. MJM16]